VSLFVSTLVAGVTIVRFPVPCSTKRTQRYADGWVSNEKSKSKARQLGKYV
jgi:hypothetical protein